MSAVRMVAYGVLELKLERVTTKPPPWLEDYAEEKRYKEERFKRDELRKLVNDELKKYDMGIAPEVSKNVWGGRSNNNVLYGPATGAFLARQEIKIGTFKECCEAAVELLDKLEEH